MSKRIIGMAVMVALCGYGVMAEEAAPAKEAVAVKPTAAESGESRTLLTSGRELLTQGKIPEAVALLEKARALEPQSNEASFLLSAAYI